MGDLIVILGDQLDAEAGLLRTAGREDDRLWMAETAAESKVVWSSQMRSAFFLAAMRHFRDHLRGEGWMVDYLEVGASGGRGLGELLAEAIARQSPARVRVTEPGEYRVEVMLKDVCARAGVALEIVTDDHFLCSREQFRRHARGRKQLRQEFFYREMRTRTGILMEADGKPVGGQWNYDAENRRSFGREGPPTMPPPPANPPDAVTRGVLADVARELAGHPGRLADFNWPVTRSQALAWLEHFIAHGLPQFGDYQDAMWQDEPFLFHSRLSAAMNVKLLSPAEVIAAAVAAWRAGKAPLNAVEGFVRQILGWREYVRGIYWLHMPRYLELNELQATARLPEFYWTGETEYACLRAAINQTLDHGYAHHIQRLMVTGLYAMMLGVEPQQVHAWYLAVYVDAVEWVELPNTLGMSQHADGGIMASKPYAATGKYIQRMSNYCQGCPKRPELATGPQACPFTTLYWDFLSRHETRLNNHPRMALQVRNLQRLDLQERANIAAAAARLRESPVAG